MLSAVSNAPLERARVILSRRNFLRALFASIGAAVAGAAYAIGWGPMQPPRITRYRLTPPGWPKDFPLTVAALADTHACEPWMSVARLERIVEQTNALQPDIVVLLGDYGATIDKEYRFAEIAPAEWAPAFAKLRAPLGVHAILGNHDWWEDEEAQRVGRGPTIARRELEKVGIAVYENDAVRLIHRGRGLWLAGLADQWAILDAKGRATGLDDLPGTLAKLTTGEPAILLAHEPDIFPSVPARIALTLCGHTHGGQIRLFGFSPIVPSRWGRRYAYGHIVEEGRDLIVSGGLGCSIFPVRVGVAPEIVLVELGSG
jgi:predicted MPP superfamily phosphohydrolase